MKAIDYHQALGDPGQFPFTRGIQPTMYRGRLWTMRQYAGFGTAEETNRRFRYLLDHGQTGLSVAFDLPTQMGYDSDHPMAAGEVGRVGVAIDTVEDMELLFRKIPLAKVSTSMTINATAPILLPLYSAVAQKQKAPLRELKGTLQNDLLKEYIARGTYIYPIDASLRLTTDLFEYCQKNLPKWNTISVSGYHMREAGCTAVQEVAFTLMNGLAYLEAATRRGLSIDRLLPQISFFFGVQIDFLEEIGKFRAARRLWARLLKERFRVRDQNCLKLKFHAQTAGASLTAQQAENNVVRITMQALAALLGGTQSLHTNSYDEALALPTEESARLALRTQQVIALESGVVNTVDPVGGAYEIELITDRIEEEALGYIKKIDQMGGMVRAIESGYIQREIQNAAFEHQKSIESKQRIVVGLNEFRIGEGKRRPLQKIDRNLEKKQRERLARFRKKRDRQLTERSLRALNKTARGRENLVPLIVHAVKVGATLGEISETLRQVFGEYREKVVV